VEGLILTAQPQNWEGKFFSMYILLSVILLGSFILYCLEESLKKRQLYLLALQILSGITVLPKPLEIYS
jgi:hypothetical protein